MSQDEEQSSFRTKGQKKHHAGLVVSMATWVPGGVNNPAFRSRLLSFGGERRDGLHSFKNFCEFLSWCIMSEVPVPSVIT